MRVFFTGHWTASKQQNQATDRTNCDSKYWNERLDDDTCSDIQNNRSAEVISKIALELSVFALIAFMIQLPLKLFNIV
jgi:hypothetical protein